MRTFLSDTEQQEFFSATRGRSYVLSVVLPEGYDTSEKRYPVVYVLDGDLNFGRSMRARWPWSRVRRRAA